MPMVTLRDTLELLVLVFAAIGGAYEGFRWLWKHSWFRRVVQKTSRLATRAWAYRYVRMSLTALMVLLVVSGAYRLAIGTLSVKKTARALIGWENQPQIAIADNGKVASPPAVSSSSDSAMSRPLWSPQSRPALHQPINPEPLTTLPDPQAPAFAISWTQLDETLPTPMAYMSAVKMGKLVYLVGGCGSDSVPIATAYAFDPEQRTFRPLKPMSTQRMNVRAVAARNTLYVLGGTNGNPVSAVERYSPKEDTWHVLEKPMPTARIDPACAAWKGLIYAIGGDSPAVEVLDLDTGIWTNKVDLASYGAGRNACVWRDRLYLLGGTPPVVSCDLPGMSWVSNEEGFQSARADVAYTMREDGSVFAVGGWNGVEEVASVDVCQAPGEKWWSLSPLPTRRKAGAVVTCDDKLIYFGGMYGPGRVVGTIFEGTIIRR